jgi:hypothetical protein
VLLLEHPLRTTMAAAATAMAPLTFDFIRIPLPCVRYENFSTRRARSIRLNQTRYVNRSQV